MFSRLEFWKAATFQNQGEHQVDRRAQQSEAVAVVSHPDSNYVKHQRLMQILALAFNLAIFLDHFSVGSHSVSHLKLYFQPHLILINNFFYFLFNYKLLDLLKHSNLP